MHGNTKDEIRGRSRHRNRGERVGRNLEERKVGTTREKRSKQDLTSAKDLTKELPVGTIREKRSKQDLTSAKDLTKELSEGHDSPYNRIDYLT